MKKLFKIILYSFGFLLVIGIIISVLEEFGLKEPTTKSEISEIQSNIEEERHKY